MSHISKILKNKARVRSLMHRVLFAVLLYAACWQLIQGQNGLTDFQELSKTISIEQKRVATLTARLEGINKQILAYQKEDFVVELTARQTLQMAKPDEFVYLSL